MNESESKLLDILKTEKTVNKSTLEKIFPNINYVIHQLRKQNIEIFTLHNGKGVTSYALAIHIAT